MTRNYSRSGIFSFSELDENLQMDVKSNFCFEDSDAHSTNYVLIEFEGEKEALPLSMFMRTNNNNFTHGIFSLSYFSGYFLTLSRCNTEAVISYKYF